MKARPNIFLKLTFVFLFSAISWQSLFGQSERVDSIIAAAETHTVQDKNLVDNYNLIAYYQLSMDVEKSGKYAHLALKLASKLKYIEGQLNAKHHLGQYYLQKGNVLVALESFIQAKRIAEENKYLTHYSLCYDDIGDVFMQLDDYNRALFYYSISLDISLKYPDEMSYYFACRSVGDAYRELKNIDSAKRYYNLSRPFFQKGEYKVEEGKFFLGLGILFYRSAELDSCNENLKKCISILEKRNFVGELTTAYKFAGYRAWRLADKENSKIYFDKAQMYAAQLKDRLAMADVFASKADWYYLVKNLDSTKYFASKAFNEYRLLSQRTRAIYSFGHLAQVASITNDKVFLNNMVQEINKLILITDRKKDLALVEVQLAKSEIGKYESDISIFNERNDLQKQKFYILAICAALLLIIISVLVYLVIQRTNSLTKIKKLQQDTAIAYKREEEHNIIKSKLIFILSHDLRSPLTSVQGLLSLHAKQMVATNELNAYFDNLGSEVQNSIFLLDNLLNWIKTQTDGIKISITKVSLKTLVQECLSIYRYSIIQKKLQVVFQVPDDAMVSADENILRIALRNIIGNSLKYTPAGRKVSIYTEKHDNTYHLFIKDNGIGIHPSILNDIQIGKPITTRPPGTEKGAGVGLLFSTELLQKMGATYSIDTKMGEGTTFLIYLNA